MLHELSCLFTRASANTSTSLFCIPAAGDPCIYKLPFLLSSSISQFLFVRHTHSPISIHTQRRHHIIQIASPTRPPHIIRTHPSAWKLPQTVNLSNPLSQWLPLQK